MIDYSELIERLNASWYRNPEGPEAAGAIKALQTEVERLTDLYDRLKLEAQGHAQEARTQTAIVNGCYQIVTAATGEPGNWHGAEPIKNAIETLQTEVSHWRKEYEGARKIICGLSILMWGALR
jgi:hypothetical protein